MAIFPLFPNFLLVLPQCTLAQISLQQPITQCIKWQSAAIMEMNFVITHQESHPPGVAKFETSLIINESIWLVLSLIAITRALQSQASCLHYSLKYL